MTDSITAQDVRERILHTFSIYPKISPSMLQISLNLPTIKWRPVLKCLIEENVIRQTSSIVMTPGGRNQSYVILTLINGNLA